MTVAELERRMSAEELAEWQEYESIEPFGAWRDNWHAAQIVAAIYNVNRARGTPAFSVGDFMFEDGDTRRERRDAATIAFLDRFAKREK
jgi:hypothetical protein